MNIIDLEVVKQARKDFKEAYEEESDSCAMVGFVTNNGLFVSNNTACHASLSEAGSYMGEGRLSNLLWHSPKWDGGREGWERDAPLITVISGFMQPMNGGGETYEDHNISDDMLKAFFNWMLTESPWKDCFLNPSAEDVFDNHWLMDINQQHQLFCNAAFATRLPSEYPDRFRVWWEFFTNGQTGAEAYAAAMMLRAKKGGFYPTHIYQLSGHSPIDNLSYTMYERLTTSAPKLADAMSYAKKLTYRSVNKIWGEDRGGDYKDFEKIRPVIERDQVNLDIFYQNKRRDGGFEFINFEETMSAWTQVKDLLKGKKK